MEMSVTAPPVIQPSGNAIIVNSVQRTNPLLEAIRNVSKEYGDIIPDFQVGRTTCVLYLSLKYHRLHPEYIHRRIEKLGHMYNLRILLVLCDIDESREPIRELTKTCLINNITVIVAWSIDEGALYLSTFKQFEHKPPDLIKERVDKDYNSVLRSALTSVKGINKTDVETLRSNCGSFAGISRASEEVLFNLPGFAQIKVKRLRDAFHRPFWNFSTDRLAPMRASSHNSQVPPEGETNNRTRDTFSGSKRPREKSPLVVSASVPRRRPSRSPSPVWDIELDLNDFPSPALMDSLPATKKTKMNHSFGEPSSILDPR